ncbi:MAG: helix-turn-helix transcriptional regulator [Xanthomonadaceae bacterium]|nr:helix-turn-helix transcriptional regulator [Xanthomonadaceae bacterium]MDP2185292.1 helix-turn-helix transcriptional regulator [Xanthomonadales bacterium]MDZ4115831.1 helix-turn-helix transcriptional regulator [Xanthomonadaceae bacterium]MDZ4378660.1 helix-turn-helix transcriptional regulator [Xanthomonadaceae bacterium]
MIKIHEGSTNVYADLGRADADEMLVKAQLATKIAALMTRRRMTQVQASLLFGMPQPKVSAMLRGQFRGISEEKMMRCLLALGQHVEIVVKPARKGQTGTLSVAA